MKGFCFDCIELAEDCKCDPNKESIFIPGIIRIMENGSLRELKEHEWDGISFGWFFKACHDREKKDLNENYGYLYLLENRDGKEKIGRSLNPQNRIRSIETQGNLSVKNFFISHITKKHTETESKMHRKFKENREKGEWFNIPFATAKEYLQLLTEPKE